MKKILSSLLVLVLGLILVTGCEKGEKKVQNTNSTPNTTTNSNGKITSSKNLVNSSGILTCTREGVGEGDILPTFSYVVTYRDGELLTLRAIEKVSSESGTGLDSYYNAYKNINSKYDGLDYYNSVITKTDTFVTRDTTIDYEHIDIDKLMEIEGREDNIIDDNNKASLDKWLTFANKFGTKCDESGV